MIRSGRWREKDKKRSGLERLFVHSFGGLEKTFPLHRTKSGALHPGSIALNWEENNMTSRDQFDQPAEWEFGTERLFTHQKKA